MRRIGRSATATLGGAVLCLSVAAAPPPGSWTADADRADMMRQLGITALVPGPSGDERAPDHANIDEARATPYPELPDQLTFRRGGKVVDAAGWRHRRTEILEDYAREVYGRVPAHLPPVAWRVMAEERETIGSHPVIARRVIGHVENSADPAASVDIRLTQVLPAGLRRPVPVLIMLSFAGPPPRPAASRDAGGDPPPTEQLIAAGWGYVTLDPTSIQADDGAGLRRGIIGLGNRGAPRRPDDWGALRAWAWGASQVRSWLAHDPAVDGPRIGIEGVSRYGKAALVAMAFDPAFAVGLIGSSGKGGATLLRRNFGESVANLATGEYHWFAGSFLKYDTKGVSQPGLDAADLPVDANELIALAAPRPLFLSHGVPEAGDAHWIDQRGAYLAARDGGRVYRLLSADGIGPDAPADMPPPDTMIDGTLAWRQHRGGHTDAPNFRFFIPWAERQLKLHPKSATG